MKGTGKVFIAVDLGAGSGRLMAAHADGRTLALEEVHRFDNPGTDLPGGLYWNTLGIYREILTGLKRAAESYGERIAAIGIDSWGCDFGLFDARGEMLGLSHQYRDPRSAGMENGMHARVPEEKMFRRSGVRTLFYNTSLHLFAEASRQSPALATAERLLFTPDLLAYWLTGRQATERTIASTSQLLDARTGEWSWETIRELGLPERIFGRIVSPGTVLGSIRPEVSTVTGLKNVTVVASASHDTAAAVAGIPLQNADAELWLSCGTWSVMGIESAEAITTPEAFDAGFGNERGADGSIRFLKNISGLWIIQECRRHWEQEGEALDFATLAALADAAEPFVSFIDPDDPGFSSPGDMPEKIRAFCRRTGQPEPAGKGEILRVATESLAFKYRQVRDRIEALSGRRFERLSIGGGGIQNEALVQATASALGIEVVAGPVEATSCGNAVVQMIATGDLPDLTAGRELIRRSFDFKTYYPQQTADWDQAAARWSQVLESTR